MNVRHKRERLRNMKKEIAVTYEILSENNLAFNIIDLTLKEQMVSVGDIETIQSILMEEYIPSEIKVYIGKTDLGRLIGGTLQVLGFEVEYLSVHFEIEE